MLSEVSNWRNRRTTFQRNRSRVLEFLKTTLVCTETTLNKWQFWSKVKYAKLVDNWVFFFKILLIFFSSSKTFDSHNKCQHSRQITSSYKCLTIDKRRNNYSIQTEKRKGTYFSSSFAWFWKLPYIYLTILKKVLCSYSQVIQVISLTCFLEQLTLCQIQIHIITTIMFQIWCYNYFNWYFSRGNVLHVYITPHSYQSNVNVLYTAMYCNLLSNLARSWHLHLHDWFFLKCSGLGENKSF